MAGHSKFKNIMYRKGAQDKRRAKLFTKAIKDVYTAAKINGGDPGFNSRLRLAINAARSLNVPKNKIDAAIDRALNGTSGDGYEEILYEGYTSNGIAVLVKVETDNKNRTFGDVRTMFLKHDGILGESGSVNHMFENIGVVTYESRMCYDEMMQHIIEFDNVHELNVLDELDEVNEDVDIEKNNNKNSKINKNKCEKNKKNEGAITFFYEVICKPEYLHSIKSSIEARLEISISDDNAYITWRPITYASMHRMCDNEAKETKQKVKKFIEALEDIEDVTYVVTNTPT